MKRHPKVAMVLGSAGLLLSICGASAIAAAKSHSAASFPKQSLTIYAALTSTNGALLQQDFNQYDPNANLTIVTGGTGTLLSRIAAEQEAGQVHANVIMLADPISMNGLNSEGVLTPYTPSGTKKLAANLKGTNWEAPFYFNNVIIYHKGMSLPIPKSWTDLTKSVYKNELEIGDPSYSGTTLGMAGYLMYDYGWSYFQKLETNNATMVSSTNTVGEDVASGAKDVGISLDSVARADIAAGSPVGIVWPKDGAIPVPAPVGIVKGNNNATARLFVNWLFSATGQNDLQQMGYDRSLGTATNIPKGTKIDTVNWKKISSEQSFIDNGFEQIFAE